MLDNIKIILYEYLRDKKCNYILKVFNDDQFRSIPHLLERVVKACDDGDWQKCVRTEETLPVPLKLAKTSRKSKPII